MKACLEPHRALGVSRYINRSSKDTLYTIEKIPKSFRYKCQTIIGLVSYLTSIGNIIINHVLYHPDNSNLYAITYIN